VIGRRELRSELDGKIAACELGHTALIRDANRAAVGEQGRKDNDAEEDSDVAKELGCIGLHSGLTRATPRLYGCPPLRAHCLWKRGSVLEAVADAGEPHALLRPRRTFSTGIFLLGFADTKLQN
jgi:hypothetical protein